MRTQAQLLERLIGHAQEIADIKLQAEIEYERDVRAAAAARDRKIEAAVRKQKGLINEFKGTATNVMIQQGRNWSKPIYDNGWAMNRKLLRTHVTLPDRIILCPQGLKLEQDYEDRGYTETSRRMVEWADLLHWRAGNLEALPKWDTPYHREMNRPKTKTVNT